MISFQIAVAQTVQARKGSAVTAALVFFQTRDSVANAPPHHSNFDVAQVLYTFIRRLSGDWGRLLRRYFLRAR